MGLTHSRIPNGAIIRKIGLVNHMGFGNLGDDATQAAVIRNIKTRWPDVEVTVFSMNPSDTRSRHGVASYPIRAEFGKRRENHPAENASVDTRLKKELRKFPLLFRFLQAAKRIALRLSRLFDEFRFLSKSYLIVRRLDLLIISGGGQLLESWGGPWNFPYTIFIWTVLAKLSLIRCYVLNVGAGPLEAPLAKWFVKYTLELATYTSFRDSKSRELVTSLGFRGMSHVSADCVCVLDVPPVREGAAISPKGRVVGLSPMAYCDPRVYWLKDQPVYESLVNRVASFGKWLRQRDYQLTLFSTDIGFDLQTIEEVKRRIERASEGRSRVNGVKQPPITGVDELLAEMQSMDYIVTCRFHGVVFAHLLNKPVLALSHHPKVKTLMDDLGLSQYCLDIRGCTANMLQDTFLALVEETERVKSRMAEKLVSYQRNLLTQFDSLFPPRTHSARSK